MKIRTNVKAGGLDSFNHNEKLASHIRTIDQKKALGKKLRLSKETIRELRDSDLKKVAGGAIKSTAARYSCGTCECEPV